MDDKGKIYSIRYTYTLDGRTCHTTWVGRAQTPEAAIERSSNWYEFEKSGATVIDTQYEELTFNKE